MERNLGIINESIEFEEVIQFVPIDTKTDAVIINIKNKQDEEEKNHTNKNRTNKGDSSEQIYIKQVVNGEDVYLSLPKDMNNITTDDLSKEVFTACGLTNNKSNKEQKHANEQKYDVVFNDYDCYDDNLYKNCIKVYDHEAVRVDPDSRDKEYVSINVGNELESFKAMLNEKLLNNRISLTNYYGELASIDNLHYYQNTLPENDVVKTKQVTGIDNFVANGNNGHNTNVKAIDQTNQDYSDFSLDVTDTELFKDYTGNDNLAFDESNSVAGDIMINDKTNCVAGSFNETADEKSLISDDISLKRHSNDSVNCNSDFDEIKYRFKGPVFRSFCEKKRKRNWKRRSLGGELKLMLKV